MMVIESHAQPRPRAENGPQGVLLEIVPQLLPIRPLLLIEDSLEYIYLKHF
jgi:hypothetical protein